MIFEQGAFGERLIAMRTNKVLQTCMNFSDVGVQYGLRCIRFTTFVAHKHFSIVRQFVCVQRAAMLIAFITLITLMYFGIRMREHVRSQVTNVCEMFAADKAIRLERYVRLQVLFDGYFRSVFSAANITFI